MKSKINLILSLCVLVFIAMACNASFTTANISSFNFGKNDKADPATTTFNVGEKVYAVAIVSNTSSKHKMRFNFESVSNNGVKPLTKELDFEGSRPVFLELTIPAGGDYKVEATLFDESGKEIDKKSGTFNVKGGSTEQTKPATESKSESNKDADSDEN
jgi:hypothetical protein